MIVTFIIGNQDQDSTFQQLIASTGNYAKWKTTDNIISKLWIAFYDSWVWNPKTTPI